MQLFWSSFLPLIGYIVFILFLILLSKARKVPLNTTIIIDRNTHFYKKKSRGYYFFNPSTDKVTTKVSSFPITETYRNIFQTHEDTYYNISFSMTYICKEPEQTLDSLADSKRSIYDIANCAVETLRGSLSAKDIALTPLAELSEKLFQQLESTLEYFYIDVIEAHINNYNIVDEEIGKKAIFQKHTSSSSDPIQ